MVTESPTVILGAGLCGLSAAYHLQKKGADFIVIERESRAGGLARTESCDGFSFDHSIHILYTRDAFVTRLLCDELLAGNIGRQARQSFCHSEGVYTEYPYQTNQYGLSTETIIDNLLGLFAARAVAQDAPLHFEDWIYRTFGSGIADRFMIPYNRQQWAWDLKDMDYDWIANRVPMPELRDVLLGALRPPTQKHGLNQEFWYPLEGGIEALPRAFARSIAPENLITKSCVTSVDSVGRVVTLGNGEQVRFERLISTLPLPVLVRLLGAAVPGEIVQRAASLKHNMVHTVNVGFELDGTDSRNGMHWAYYPEEDLIFHRASFPGAFSSWMTPPNCGSVQVEISESVHRPLDRPTLVQRALDDLRRVGIIRDRNKVLTTGVVTLDPAYIIYDLKHRENTRVVLDYLSDCGIDSRGRFGEWEYFNMDDAILSGKAAAEAVL